MALTGRRPAEIFFSASFSLPRKNSPIPPSSSTANSKPGRLPAPVPNPTSFHQNWALEAIYALFDRKKILPLLRGYGRFSRADLETLIWSNYTSEEQNVFLGMMEDCGICFRVRELPHVSEDGNDENYENEWEYIAPELLPKWSDAQELLLARLARPIAR